MKEIDESFFFTKDSKTFDKGEDFLDKDEKILWRGIPKKSSFVMQETIHLMPIAVLWGLIDFSAIAMILTSAPSFILLFIIPFFALHLTPFWIWVAGIIKSKRKVKNIEYYITNKRIFELNGNPKYISNSVNLCELTSANYKQSSTDRLFRVGDIYIVSDNAKFVLFDIPNGEFIHRKITELCKRSTQEKEKKEFYKNNCICDHCGSFYDEKEPKCPNCGAPKIIQK